jgi:hypothetical protein
MEKGIECILPHPARLCIEHAHVAERRSEKDADEMVVVLVMMVVLRRTLGKP